MIPLAFDYSWWHFLHMIARGNEMGFPAKRGASMATMHPAVFPGQPNGDDPEFVAYQILRKLPDSFDVFYSKKFKGSRRFKDECEVDFIILDSGSALLCLEVKGGLIEYDDGDQVWRQNGAKMRRMPDRQASATIGPVIEYLAPPGANLNFEWGLFFPQCCRPHNLVGRLPPGLKDAQIIDEQDMLDIVHAVERLRDHTRKAFGRPGIGKRDREAVVGKLTRTVHFVRKVGVRLETDCQQLVEVTAEQLDVLEDLESNNRIVVRGCAGSGKTLLAQEFARRLAAEGKRVLLLFYNRVISNTARRAFARNASVECMTFHSLARRLITEEDPDWWHEQSRGDGNFWDLTVPARLFDVQLALPKYDAVIVDEGQDFKREWYEFLEQLMVDSPDGRFSVFYDERQDIFGHWGDLPWGADGVARKVLTKNCRNTKAIIDYLNTSCGCEMRAFAGSPTGLAVVTRNVANRLEEMEQLRTDVAELLKQGVRPAQIILLLNGPRDDSAIADVGEIGGAPVEWVGRSLRADSQAVRFAGISVFKGLEADAILVLGCREMSNSQLTEALYVQGSRARALLYVYR